MILLTYAVYHLGLVWPKICLVLTPFVRTKLVEPFKTFYTPVGNVRIRGIRASADSVGTQSVEAWIMAELTEYLVMHQLASSLDGAGTV